MQRRLIKTRKLAFNITFVVRVNETIFGMFNSLDTIDRTITTLYV